MTRASKLHFVLVGISALLLAVGCAKPPPPEEVLLDNGSGGMEMEATVPSEANVEVEPVPQPIELAPIYFDYDRASVRDDMKAALRESADKILENTAWGAVIVEGHCDERGSEEYNFALGERRAATVKKYLVALGVPAERLETVSFGETQLAVKGHDESAWRYNRRVEFRSAR